MARPLEVDWQDTAATLYKHYKGARDPQDRTRLQALWRVRQGDSLEEAAKTVGVHPVSIGRWLGWYRQGGLGEVLCRRHGGSGGQAAYLSAEKAQGLLGRAEAGEVRSIQDGVAWAKEAHGIHYSYWGMRHVFARLGLKKKVPRPKSPKASQEAQAAWKRGG
jgi:transposase